MQQVPPWHTESFTSRQASGVAVCQEMSVCNRTMNGRDKHRRETMMVVCELQRLRLLAVVLVYWGRPLHAVIEEESLTFVVSRCLTDKEGRYGASQPALQCVIPAESFQRCTLAWPVRTRPGTRPGTRPCNNVTQ